MSEPAAASRRRFLQYIAASPLAIPAAALLPAFAQQRIGAEVLKATDVVNVFELEAIAKRNIRSRISAISPAAFWTTARSNPTGKRSMPGACAHGA